MQIILISNLTADLGYNLMLFATTDLRCIELTGN